MSLARALLALACAAPLLAARAPATVSVSVSTDAPGHDDGQCTSIMIGSSTKNVLTLPSSVIPAGVQKARLDIPNNCNPLALKGERVTVCDEDEAPEVDPPPNGAFTPFMVIRKGRLLTDARVYVYQHCH